VHLLKILGTAVLLFGSLGLSILAGSLAARFTRRVSAWCLLTLAGCVLLNAAFLVAASPIFQWLSANDGAPLDWQRMAGDGLRFAGCGALLGLLGFLVDLKHAPRFFNDRP
jgi:hypothetical protein